MSIYTLKYYNDDYDNDHDNSDNDNGDNSNNDNIKDATNFCIVFLLLFLMFATNNYNIFFDAATSNLTLASEYYPATVALIVFPLFFHNHPIVAASTVPVISLR